MTETREVYEQRRQVVAEAILANPQHFNMGDFIAGTSNDSDPMCGTTCCIAGWAAMQRPDVELVRFASGDVELVDVRLKQQIQYQGLAADWLGLSGQAAYDLFYGRFSSAISMADVTPAEAVEALMAAPYIAGEQVSA